MGPVAFFSLCLLGCLIFNPSLEASPRRERSLWPGSGVKAAACRRDWFRYGDYCFKFFPEQVTWSAAEVQCQRHQPRAHLASIHSDAERDRVADYVTKLTPSHHVWIGLHNPNKDKTWVWTDGSVYCYNAWNDGEPNYGGGREYCVEMWSSTGYKKWNDVTCETRRPYLCKYRF
ncbi:C-type lectin BfL-2-like [Pelodiscus sinensis]|uniref:C-type lectin BfL-2-like n=1 Tax=Pelodiscus sinensis TaxID=13735 RepID=UPI003F6A8459